MLPAVKQGRELIPALFILTVHQYKYAAHFTGGISPLSCRFCTASNPGLRPIFVSSIECKLTLTEL